MDRMLSKVFRPNIGEPSMHSENAADLIYSRKALRRWGPSGKRLAGSGPGPIDRGF
jgi:hypothetical protein